LNRYHGQFWCAGAKPGKIKPETGKNILTNLLRPELHTPRGVA